MMNAKYVVIGGGIAGVSCVSELRRRLSDDDDDDGGGDEKIILVTFSQILKTVRNVRRETRTIETFDVVSEDSETFQRSHPGIVVVRGVVERIGSKCVHVFLDSEERIKISFEKLCVCTGATPLKCHPSCVTIRDTDSVRDLSKTLKGEMKRIAIIGNGGIAMEIVQSLRGSNLEIVWCIRDDFICNTMLDVNASMFFMNMMDRVVQDDERTHDDGDFVDKHNAKQSFTTNIDMDKESLMGSGVGPHWRTLFRSALLDDTDDDDDTDDTKKRTRKKGTCTIRLETRVSLKNIITRDKKKIVQLSNGHEHECDLVISAIGVRPNIKLFQDLNVKCEDGVAVDEQMRVIMTNSSSTKQNVFDSIYAAGDVTSVNVKLMLDDDDDDESTIKWFQMRLWSQARLQGLYAARCMCGEIDELTIGGGIAFEMFSHTTSFFDHKVVLLGLYNGQTLGEDYMRAVQRAYAKTEIDEKEKQKQHNHEVEIFLRMTPGIEYIKLVVRKHRLVGALLIGETDYEEALENLILSGTKLSETLKSNILDPDFDLADYFD